MGIGQDKTKGSGDPLCDFVNSTINSNDVVIFSKSYCPFCDMAKNIFDEINQTYKAIELDRRKDCSEIQKILGRLTGESTVPRVFVKGKSVGGATETKNLFQSGQLKKMLSC